MSIFPDTAAPPQTQSAPQKPATKPKAGHVRKTVTASRMPYNVVLFSFLGDAALTSTQRIVGVVLILKTSSTNKFFSGYRNSRDWAKTAIGPRPRFCLAYPNLSAEPHLTISLG